MVKKEVLIFGIAILAIVAVAFLFFDNEQTESTQLIPGEVEDTPISNIFESDWTRTVLKNINTQEEFRLSDFEGKPILLESFAVWCPTCTVQQTKIKELHEEIGDSFISISFDTDPNEDEERVKEHTERNGFDWIYVVSPPDFTRALIDEFGINFVNAPLAPVALICPDGTSKKLRNGVKSPSELKTEIESCNS